MRRNSITFIENTEIACSLCYEEANRYVILCDCSNEKYCLKCHKSLEDNNHHKCPYCRRNFNKQVFIDYRKRNLLFGNYFLKLIVYLLATIFLPYITILTNLNNYNKYNSFEKAVNDPTLVLTLVPFCSLLINPVNAIFVSAYTHLNLNNKIFYQYYLVLISYSSLIHVIILLSRTKHATGYIFTLFLLPITLTPFMMGLVYLLLVFCMYFYKRLGQESFSRLKIIPIEVVNMNRRTTFRNFLNIMGRNRVNPSDSDISEANVLDNINQTEYTLEDEELYNSLYIDDEEDI